MSVETVGAVNIDMHGIHVAGNLRLQCRRTRLSSDTRDELPVHLKGSTLELEGRSITEHGVFNGEICQGDRHWECGVECCVDIFRLPTSVTDEWRFASSEPAAKQEVSRSCHEGHPVRNDTAHPRGRRPEWLIQRERALDSDGVLRFACIAEIKIAGARCIQTLELALRCCFIAKGLHKRSGEPNTNTKHARARLFGLAREYAISTN